MAEEDITTLALPGSVTRIVSGPFAALAEESAVILSLTAPPLLCCRDLYANSGREAPQKNSRLAAVTIGEPDRDRRLGGFPCLNDQSIGCVCGCYLRPRAVDFQSIKMGITAGADQVADCDYEPPVRRSRPVQRRILFRPGVVIPGKLFSVQVLHPQNRIE